MVEAVVVGAVEKALLAKSVSSGLDLLAQMTGANVLFTYHPDLQRELKLLDIETRLSTIEAMVQDMSKKERSAAVKKALAAIESTVTKIQALLQQISDEVKLHSTRWFSTWRYANYGGMLEHLKDEVKVLDSRQQLLQTMLNVESFM